MHNLPLFLMVFQEESRSYKYSQIITWLNQAVFTTTLQKGYSFIIHNFID